MLFESGRHYAGGFHFCASAAAYPIINLHQHLIALPLFGPPASQSKVTDFIFFSFSVYLNVSSNACCQIKAGMQGPQCFAVFRADSVNDIHSLVATY